MQPDLYIGMISGTSIDAVDCALVEITDTSIKPVDFICQEIPETLKEQLAALCVPGTRQIQLMGQADGELGSLFARAALNILEKNGLNAGDISAIGSHGQTIWHEPPDKNIPLKIPYTIQIGDPNIIASLTGITTVADFRRKDMALGGQGAPIVPAFHREVFSSNDTDRIILNTGGIANITLLAKNQQQILGFDTGPANGLMDCWIKKCKGLDYDDQGQWAASTRFNPALLEHFLNESYFSLPHPKSTGRELFNAFWLDQKLSTFASAVEQATVQSTLLELSVETVSRDILSLTDKADVIVCGGGASNRQLLTRLQERLPAFKVTSSDSLGFHSDSVEAFAFAWLASKRMQNSPVDFTSITGSSRPAVSGAIYSPD